MPLKISNFNKKIISITLIEIVFSILFVFILINIINEMTSNPLGIENNDNIIFDNTEMTLKLDSMTLKQKIAQMIITIGKNEEKDNLQRMVIGGIHFSSKPTKDSYVSIISSFQNSTAIPFFVTIDLEGCSNPFDNFQYFPSSSEIETEQQAYNIGYEEGILLNEMGFNINFMPIVDLNDNIWNCRAFTGTPEEISRKAVAYINGIQENGIIATAKHYPGKTLVNDDPHLHIIEATIEEEDLLPFNECIKNNVSAIMVSHIIVNGSIDSESKPSSTSYALISNLRKEFNGLIITDEVGMGAIRNFYKNDLKMYMDLFKADNDLILVWGSSNEIYDIILLIEKAVKDGEISEERIDKSVTRILIAKGINVV